MDHSIRELVSGGIDGETKRTLENIKAVLSHHNLVMTYVVKVMVLLDNIEEFAAFNTVYAFFFPQKRALTAFAVKALARGAKIEIAVRANSKSPNSKT